MKSTLLRCESRQGLFCHTGILMPAMTLRNFLPATLAEKMLYMREQVPRKTTAEIGCFFRCQVYPKIFADMRLGMADFVHKAIEELLRRGGLTYHKDSDSMPRTCIGQSRVLLPSTKIMDSQTHRVHIRTH